MSQQTAAGASLAGKIVLLLVAVTIGVALAEVAARYVLPKLQPWAVASAQHAPGECRDIMRFDEHVGWWLLPNLDCLMPHEDTSIRLRTNAAGLRAERDYGPKRPGVLRVGVFGDSYTFGSGVEAADLYSAAIEQNVEGVEVLNFGLGAGGPDQSLLALRYIARDFDLDVVVIAPTVENILRILMLERGGRQKPYFTFEHGTLTLHNYPAKLTSAPGVPTNDGSSDVRRFLMGSALYQLLLPGARAASLWMGAYKPFKEYYDGPAGELLTAILTAFRTEAPDAALIFAPLPTYHYIEYGMEPDYETVFRRAAQNANGQYVDVLDAFSRLSPTEKRATRFKFDQHYSALAHRVVAEALSTHIAALRDRSTRGSASQ